MEAVYPMKFDLPHRGLEWLEYYSGHDVYHPGWDLNRSVGNADYGDPAFSPFNGEIEFVSPAPTRLNSQNGGFGWFIIVYHEAYGVWTRLAHLSKVLVSVADKVKTGEEIAEVGNSGTTFAHLHFEIFGKKMWEIQRKHWRKFGYYPSGKSKSWVSDHYKDGLMFIDDINAEDGSAYQEAVDWAVKNGVSNGERLTDPATREETIQMIYNYDQLDK